MIEAGKLFGEESSLGSMYIRAGAAQVDITKAWYAINVLRYRFLCTHDVVYTGFIFSTMSGESICNLWKYL